MTCGGFGCKALPSSSTLDSIPLFGYHLITNANETLSVRGSCKLYLRTIKYSVMLAIDTSPLLARTLDERLRVLYLRRSVVDRLIRALETYQEALPARVPRKTRVA